MALQFDILCQKEITILLKVKEELMDHLIHTQGHKSAYIQELVIDISKEIGRLNGEIEIYIIAKVSNNNGPTA